MSTRIYAAYENPTHDPHIAEPILEALFRSGLGHQRARIQPPITNPHLHGITQLLGNLEAIATRYAPMAACVAFVADLDREDGEDGRKDRRAAFQARVDQLPDHVRDKTLVLLAVQEVEVWALWGSRSRIADPWATVRAERDPKERYFDPLLLPGDALSLGGGRRRLAAESLASGWPSIKGGCPELAAAEDDLRARGF